MKEFKKKFKVEGLEILQRGAWIVSLRPLQVTLGSLIVSLNRPCTDLGDITEEESLHLGQVFSAIKELFSRTYKPDKINYLALMMVDSQVHFHVIPRYKSVITFNNREYQDVDWPKPPNLLETIDLSGAELQKICSYMKATE